MLTAEKTATPVAATAIKFTMEDMTKLKSSSYGEWVLKANGKPIVYYQSWAFSCCGCGAFNGFSKQMVETTWFWREASNVEQLVQWLRDGGVYHHHGGYNPGEFLFLLVDYSKSSYAGLVNHPLVKQVDGWSNKAHSGTPLNLYRLSLGKDFK